MVLSNPAGVKDEELLDIQAQQVVSNRLLWEIFMRLYHFEKPLKKVILVNAIFNKYKQKYHLVSVQSKVDDLIYCDRVLIKSTKGGRQFVELSERGKEIAKRAKAINSIDVPQAKCF